MVIVILKKIKSSFFGGKQIDVVLLTIASFLSLFQRCHNFFQTYFINVVGNNEVFFSLFIFKVLQFSIKYIYIMLLITIGGEGGGEGCRYTRPMTIFLKLFNIVDENDLFNLKLFCSHHMSHFPPIITISLSIIIK
jgi:hypothetical protein